MAEHRAEDLCVPLVKALLPDRNPTIKPDMIEDSLWGVTNQVKEQGGTLGKMVPSVGRFGWEIPGCSIDRMCAGGLTAIGFGVSYIASGMADCLIAGGVEHMGHLPMGFMRDPHPRAEEVMGDSSAFNMGMTAENIHDKFPEITKEMAARTPWTASKKLTRPLKPAR